MRTVAIGIPFGVALKLVMKAIVMPLFGAPAINARYHYLAGNAAALPWMLYAVVLGAGFGEETVFRGFFFERLGKLLGTRPVARWPAWYSAQSSRSPGRSGYRWSRMRPST